MADDYTNDDYRQSADDALESDRRDDDGMFHENTDEEHLEEDNSSPAAPADDVPSSSPADDPASDDGVDPDEEYQEGRASAVDNDNQTVGPDENPQPLEPEDDK